jgi:hypothetical protein
MANNPRDYRLWLKLIETYLPSGFKGIDRGDPLLRELEAFTEANNQFFHVANLIQAKITWSSTKAGSIDHIWRGSRIFFRFIRSL